MNFDLKWDEVGQKTYENGCDHGVLYPFNAVANAFTDGVVWNGLREVNETPEGAEPSKFYADNILYATLMSVEEYKASIGAYTYPKEFEACDGSAELATGIYIGQQTRQKFGFCYRTRIGSDAGQEIGYKLHLVYNCLAAPSDRNHESVNDSPDLDELSWDVTADPVNVAGHKPTASLTIDSREISTENLTLLESILYGVEAPAFSASSTYSVGDYVTYETKVYKCITAISTAGAWDSTKWEEVTNPGPRLPFPDEIARLVTEG